MRDYCNSKEHRWLPHPGPRPSKKLDCRGRRGGRYTREMTSRPPLLVLTVWACLAAPVLAQRLPAGVSPEHYDLIFTLDLAKARFSGKAGIDVRVSQAT